ncbi:MAG: hypothetical protein AB1591_03345 [Pseudomonadota bacterium]
MRDPISGSLRFETPPDYVSALNALLPTATHLIRIYDWDLSDGGYETPERIEMLGDFCKLGGVRSVKILLADGSYLKRHGGQMMRLLSTWGNVLQVRVRDSDPPPATDCFVLIDQKGLLKRYDKDNAKGLMNPDARGEVAELGIRFDAEWGRSAGRVSARTVGL